MVRLSPIRLAVMALHRSVKLFSSLHCSDCWLLCLRLYCSVCLFLCRSIVPSSCCSVSILLRPSFAVSWYCFVSLALSSVKTPVKTDVKQDNLALSLNPFNCWLFPQWEAADAEIKVPFDENTELKGSPFKTWSRSVYCHACYAYCQEFLPY